MRIKYYGSERETELRDIFYIGRYPWDTVDYGFTITLFGYSWTWFYNKGKEPVNLDQEDWHPQYQH